MKENVRKKIDDDSCVSVKFYKECHANGDLPREYDKENGRRKRESKSPSRRSGKGKSYLDADAIEDDGGKLSDSRKSLSSESSGDKHKMVVLSPSHDRSRDEFDTRRSRSRSCDLAKERSRSRSVMEEEAVLKRLYHYEWNVNDSEDEKVLQRSRNERHGSRDLVRDDERERSTSYSSRYIDGDDRHYSREKRDRERSWEGELERERKRVKERERSKNMEMNRERRREKQRERSRDREMYTGREERDRRRYEEEGWGGRRKEKERDRSRDRAKVSERDIDRQRDRGRDRDRTRDYYLEKERERERRSDRSRDKGRDIESDREKYVSPDDSYGNRDRYKHSRHSTRVDDRGNSRDRTRKNDQAKIHSSNGYSLEGDKATRDEEEQNDFEERVTLKLVEQEEEDLDRIKEESRKRRQAILEKYKNQQFQKQNEPNSSDVEKDKKPSEHPSQSTDVNSNIPDNSNGKSDGGNVYPVDQLFSVGKSPTQNGISASDKTSGPRGLGDGSPKVCSFPMIVVCLIIKYPTVCLLDCVSFLSLYISSSIGAE